MRTGGASIKNLTIYRKTLTDANTEYSQALTDDKKVLITISADDLTSTIQFSFTSGASGTGKKIWQGAEWVSPGFIEGGSKVVYAQSPNAGTVMVIEEWGGG